MIYLDKNNHLFSNSSMDELLTFIKKIGIDKELNILSDNFVYFNIESEIIKKKILESGAILLEENLMILDQIKLTEKWVIKYLKDHKPKIKREIGHRFEYLRIQFK